MSENYLLSITLRPSRRLAAALIAVHVAGVGLLLLLPLPTGLQAGAVIVLLASAAYTVSHHALRRSRRAITVLSFIDSEQVRLGQRNGNWQTGRVLGSSTVGTVLTVLNIALDGQRRNDHVVLLPDSLGFDDYRRLRVWLRWGPRAASDEPVVE